MDNKSFGVEFPEFNTCIEKFSAKLVSLSMDLKKISNNFSLSLSLSVLGAIYYCNRILYAICFCI